MSRLPTVAIVGRTNVGKSTLFNALLGRRAAIVNDEEGVTRDRNYILVERFDFPFTLIDTGGMAGEEDGAFYTSVRAQAEIAVEEADLVLTVFDGLAGPHAMDAEVVQFLRAAGKPCLWVVNKCEKHMARQTSAEFYALGIDEFIAISAAHHQGIRDLVEQMRLALGDLAVPRPKAGEDDEAPEGRTEEGTRPLRLAILGRPNAGKSTLINRLIGEERMVTSPEAGTTRDSIEIPLKRDGHEFLLYDTAGLRRKARVEPESLERYSNLRALNALADCQVAVLLLDATRGLPEEQDQKIADLIKERGRGLIIAVNKWDAIEKDQHSAKGYEEAVYKALEGVRHAPILFISGLSGKRCPQILDKAREIYLKGQKRVTTSELNAALEEVLRRKSPPGYRGGLVKIYYGTQTMVAPPEFVLFANYPKAIDASYQRYLKSSLREYFDFEGWELRLRLRPRGKKEE